MQRVAQLILTTSLLLGLIPTSYAQDAHRSPAQSNASEVASASDQPKTVTSTSDAKPSDPASNPASEATLTDQLMKLLVAKGILSASDLAVISRSNRAEQVELLTTLLRDKGIISQTDFESMRSSMAVRAAAKTEPATAAAKPADVPTKPVPTTPPAPTVVAAVAPTRVLPVESPKREGLIPDIKLGNGVRLKPFGFFKTSVVHDSSSPLGNDFPLPGFLGDSGPSGSPEFHVKARALRVGVNFEWIDPSPKFTITGRLELDFEGNFTRANNRNISSIRSSQPSLRLAWARIDRGITDKISVHGVFGQDWTPFGSSTLPNFVESTGLGIGAGTLYERAPQARFGMTYNVGGARNLKFQPEIALVLPAFGNLPTDAGNQLGYGERQGADSGRPELEGRFVTQFQLDRSPNVQPAQFIVSMVRGTRKAIVPMANVPAAYASAFPNGVEVESERWGYTGEVQLPTRAFTLLAKYYNGADLRFFFAGQLFSYFNDTSGMTNVVSGSSIDGSASVMFGMRNGVPVVAPQRPVRAEGGFINLGIPLSRLFGADPTERNAGWTAYFHYGYDQGKTRDVRRFGNRAKTDLFLTSLQYKLNSFVTLAVEESLTRTRAANQSMKDFGGLPLFRGVPSRQTQNLRTELAAMFNF